MGAAKQTVSLRAAAFFAIFVSALTSLEFILTFLTLEYF
jgi:hypothetical protein